jgi:hypothetical protein
MELETDQNGFGEALLLIEACAASGSETLDLGGLLLTALPDELGSGLINGDRR